MVRCAMPRLRAGSPRFRAANPHQAKQITDMLRPRPQGYAANCAAVRDADFREQLAAIQVPTLVIAGTEDAVTRRPAGTSSRSMCGAPSTPSSMPRTCPTSRPVRVQRPCARFLLAR
jgi:pimeloyl-ACP methyl ester carboxylesterase